MGTIFVESTPKKKKGDSGSVLYTDMMVKKSINIGRDIGFGLLALIIAVAVYFFTKIMLVPDIAIWAREILSLIISLLALAGFSAASKEKSTIGGSIAIFLFVIFIWQLVSGYSDHDFSKDETVRSYSSEESVRTLYPREEPYVFHLTEVGDETELFKAPIGGKFTFFYSSHNFGYEIIFNDGTVYKGDPNFRIPEKTHSVIKVRAIKPNQFVNVRLVER